jgi:hypothetical protein
MMGELEPEGECVSVDTSVPHIARVYDYWLGGYFLHTHTSPMG